MPLEYVTFTGKYGLHYQRETQYTLCPLCSGMVDSQYADMSILSWCFKKTGALTDQIHDH